MEQLAQLTLQTYLLLSKQPFFDGRGTTAAISRVLKTDHFTARVVEALCKSVDDVLRKEASVGLKHKPRNGMQIFWFSCGNCNVYTKEGVFIKDGLEMGIHEAEIVYPAADGKLLDSFKSLVKEYQVGWKKTTVDEFPLVFHQEDPLQYDLYTHNNANGHLSLPLIAVVARKYNVFDCITISDAWTDEKHGYIHKKKIYMWIKKDKIAEFQTHFNFDL